MINQTPNNTNNKKEANTNVKQPQPRSNSTSKHSDKKINSTPVNTTSKKPTPKVTKEGPVINNVALEFVSNEKADKFDRQNDNNKDLIRELRELKDINKVEINKTKKTTKSPIHSKLKVNGDNDNKTKFLNKDLKLVKELDNNNGVQNHYNPYLTPSIISNTLYNYNSENNNNTTKFPSKRRDKEPPSEKDTAAKQIQKFLRKKKKVFMLYNISKLKIRIAMTQERLLNFSFIRKKWVCLKIMT